MESQEIRDIISKIATALSCDFVVNTQDWGLQLLSESLPFDLYLGTYSNRELSNTSKKPHIWINPEQFKREETKLLNRLLVLAGKAKKVFARQTVLARIDKKVAMGFQKEHHLQVPLPGKYRYGLFWNGELVSVAIFSGSRRMRNRGEDYRSFELLRFCHKGDLLVIGGLSKLLKGFTTDFRPNDIMTYVDMDWSQSSSLEVVGFKELDRRAGQEYWITEEQQYLIADEDTREELQRAYPEGYLHGNTGSIKLLLVVQKPV